MKRLFKQNQSSYLQLLGCPDCMFIKLFIGNVSKKYSNFTFYSINRDHFIGFMSRFRYFRNTFFLSAMKMDKRQVALK